MDWRGLASPSEHGQLSDADSHWKRAGASGQPDPTATTVSMYGLVHVSIVRLPPGLKPTPRSSEMRCLPPTGSVTLGAAFAASEDASWSRHVAAAPEN